MYAQVVFVYVKKEPEFLDRYLYIAVYLQL
jgi:hypothetical protein